MAKLKALPKAMIVGVVIAALGFGAYKLLPKPAPQEVKEDVALVEDEGAPASDNVRAPIPKKKPTVVAAVEEPQEAAAAPSPTGKLPGAGISSGQKTGTNYPMVDDIVKACSRADYPLRNVISNGSVDNIHKIYTDPNSQFGVVQEDALAYQQKIDPKMMSRILAVFPFFSVEIHAIATKGSPINSLADLAGKKVVEGPEGSGTWVTVQLIKQLTGIKWETVPGDLSQAEGLNAVKTGIADVEFIVAGQPIKVLTAAQGLKLVTLNHPKLDSYGFYTKTQLPTGTYPWQGQSVTTYKVNNVLATFAYKNQYQKEIGELVSCITRKVPDLQADGHPKWRDVDPTDITRVKWPVHPAALAAIKRETQKK
jgi:TRAP transporter TAXI family solute receptor